MPGAARLYPGAGLDWRRKVTTHCVHGHEYTPENTIWREEGWRNCRTCSNRRRNARRARKQ